MTSAFVVIAIFVAVLMFPPLYRVVTGPTVFDRIVGASLTGTNGVLLLAVLGFVYERIDMFVDLAIVYALLNFVGIIAAGKYLERRRRSAIK
ncbi:MAG: pH regulation protein F [Chloroflexi bacterium]|nr:pH regulation protein F [Chloroflexota bacterium]MBM3182497.1 pH regulation protein F [Chloroflexota bacterium]MBM4452004.1 pH regulation protein F [Chloroflexota bacterium]MBM4453486.1 pH regulation protein F [Chloroflexota bacterium]